MNLTNKLCWLAGFLEADGSIGIFKHKRSPEEGGNYKMSVHVAFINNDPNIINEIDRITRKLGVTMRLQTRYQDAEKWATNYTLTAKGFTDCYVLLANLSPYMLGQKKAIAQLTMRFLASRKLGKTREKYTPLEERIYIMVRKLTKTGINKELLPSETKREALLMSDDIVRTHSESVRSE